MKVIQFDEAHLSRKEREELEECSSHLPEFMHPVALAIDQLLMRFRCAPFTQEQIDEATEALETAVEECVPLQSFIILEGAKRP